MVTANPKKFYFYDEYLWEALDFQSFQDLVFNVIGALQEGGFSKAALSGLELVSPTGMAVSVSAGIGFNEDNRVCILGSETQVTIATPSGNPAKTLVVLRPVDTNTDLITNPTDPGGPQVPLKKQLGVSVVVLNGTPSPSPTYPAISAGDIIIGGLELANGQTSLTGAEFDYSVRDIAKKQERRVRTVFADYNAGISDEEVQADATDGSLTVTLPAASSMRGKVISIAKVDSTSNAASAFSSDLISGQSTWALETQYSSMKMYSNGKTYTVY